MLIGIDTGFFYALGEKKAEALQIWKKEQLVVSVNLERSMMASHISQVTGIPALDALILASLLETGCKKILTKDPHFLKYKKKGIEITLIR